MSFLLQVTSQAQKRICMNKSEEKKLRVEFQIFVISYVCGLKQVYVHDWDNAKHSLKWCICPNPLIKLLQALGEMDHPVRGVRCFKCYQWRAGGVGGHFLEPLSIFSASHFFRVFKDGHWECRHGAQPSEDMAERGCFASLSDCRQFK